MAFSSFTWPFRRRSSSGDGSSKPTAPSAAEKEELGVTPQLLDFPPTLSPDAFRSSGLQLNQGGSAEAASSWTGSSGTLSSCSPELRNSLRSGMICAQCPRHMKDKQFWTLYFLLARSYILPYELRAIQKEKVRKMKTENGEPKDVITVEVEMQESKCSRESQTLTDDSERHHS